jgi:hypothetical protein
MFFLELRYGSTKIAAEWIRQKSTMRLTKGQ